MVAVRSTRRLSDITPIYRREVGKGLRGSRVKVKCYIRAGTGRLGLMVRSSEESIHLCLLLFVFFLLPTSPYYLPRARCAYVSAWASRNRGPSVQIAQGAPCSLSAARVTAAHALASAAEEEEGVDPSSLPRRRLGGDSSSVVHAGLRGLAKTRSNLTLGMRDFLRVVTSDTDMTEGAALAATRELEIQGLLERDPCTGGVVMVCMAMKVLRMLRQEERLSGPGFSWDEACACCSVHDIIDGELWASVDRLKWFIRAICTRAPTSPI